MRRFEKDIRALSPSYYNGSKPQSLIDKICNAVKLEMVYGTSKTLSIKETVKRLKEDFGTTATEKEVIEAIEKDPTRNAQIKGTQIHVWIIEAFR